MIPATLHSLVIGMASSYFLYHLSVIVVHKYNTKKWLRICVCTKLAALYILYIIGATEVQIATCISLINQRQNKSVFVVLFQAACYQTRCDGHLTHF